MNLSSNKSKEIVLVLEENGFANNGRSNFFSKELVINSMEIFICVFFDTKTDSSKQEIITICGVDRGGKFELPQIMFYDDLINICQFKKLVSNIDDLYKITIESKHRCSSFQEYYLSCLFRLDETGVFSCNNCFGVLSDTFYK